MASGLNDLLDAADELNSLQIGSAAAEIARVACAERGGVERVVSWWLEVLPGPQRGFPRGLVLAAVHHEVCEARAAEWAQREVELAKRWSTEVARWGSCRCERCEPIMRSHRVSWAAKELPRAAGVFKYYCLRTLMDSGYLPSDELLLAAFGQPDSHDVLRRWAEDLGRGPELARQLFERRTAPDTAVQLAAGEESLWEVGRAAFVDPASEPSREFAEWLRGTHGGDPLRVRGLSDRKLVEEAARFARPLRWPRWVDKSELPKVWWESGEIVTDEELRALAGLARAATPRAELLLEAAAARLEPASAGAFAVRVHTQWQAAGAPKAGRFARALFALWAPAGEVDRLAAGLGDLTRTELIAALEGLSLNAGYDSWILHWWVTANQPSVGKAAREILTRRASRLGVDYLAYVGSLEHHIADVASERDPSTTAKRFSQILRTAYEAERVWDGAEFVQCYMTRPRAHEAASKLLFCVGKQVCMLNDAELFADSMESVVPSAGVEVSVAHAADLGPGERERWMLRFADFEVVQPFDQLGAPLFGVEDIDRFCREAHGSMGRFASVLRNARWSWDASGDEVYLDDHRTNTRFRLRYRSAAYDPDADVEIESWKFVDRETGRDAGDVRLRFSTRVGRALRRATGR